MGKLIVRSSLYVVVLTILLGGVYPAVVFGLGQLLWKHKANGSFVESGGRVVGSELIGQGFQNPKYLHSRRSAAGKNGYDPTASGGTNKGPTDADLAKSIAAAVAEARKDRPGDSRHLLAIRRGPASLARRRLLAGRQGRARPGDDRGAGPPGHPPAHRAAN